MARGLLAVLGAPVFVQWGSVSVEPQRIELRHAVGVGLGQGGQAGHDARVRLVHNVVAMAAALAHRVEHHELGGHHTAWSEQSVGLGNSPAQPVDAGRRQADAGQRAVGEAGKVRQQAAFAVRIIGRPGDHHQNGENADGPGQAGAQQPAEAAALAPIGVVAGIDVVERTAGAAQIGVRSGAGDLRRELDPSPSQRCMAPDVHPVGRPPVYPTPCLLPAGSAIEDRGTCPIICEGRPSAACFSIPRQHYCLAMPANLRQLSTGRRDLRSCVGLKARARCHTLYPAHKVIAGVADRCSAGAPAHKVKIILTSRVDSKGWLILLKLSRATCTGARAVGSNLRIGYDASLARPGDRCRFLRDGPTQVGPPSWSPPRRSLTSELKKEKRRRRSPGGSIPCTQVHWRIANRLWRYCVS